MFILQSQIKITGVSNLLAYLKKQKKKKKKNNLFLLSLSLQYKLALSPLSLSLSLSLRYKFELTAKRNSLMILFNFILWEQILFFYCWLLF